MVSHKLHQIGASFPEPLEEGVDEAVGGVRVGRGWRAWDQQYERQEHCTQA